MGKIKLMLGDNILSLKKLPDNSIDSIVTDPPYGLSFMNKKWDHDVPSVEFWKEVYRILKPGGHILSFGGTRTYHRMVVNIEDAGFEIRDQIQWIYGSGFPKSLNVGKAVDKLEGNEREYVKESENNRTGRISDWSKEYNIRPYPPVTKGNSEWEGWGSALKPANEPICLARKPLSEKSIAENVLKWRTGGLNIDGCRIESTKEDLDGRFRSKGTDIKGQSIVGANGEYTPPIPNELGRFPANIIFDETAAEMLDEQSGFSKTNCKSGVVEGKEAGQMYHRHEKPSNNYKKKIIVGNYSDSGGASRFFYVAKVSKAERSMGLEPIEIFHQRPRREDGSIIYKEKNPEEWVKAMSKLSRKDKTSKAAAEEKLQDQSKSMKNTHPTIKPINLMSYLCKLITPKNGIILDPFMGSGSTGIAALLNDFRFCGMEMDQSYYEIAESRINNYEEYRKFLKK